MGSAALLAVVVVAAMIAGCRQATGTPGPALPTSTPAPLSPEASAPVPSTAPSPLPSIRGGFGFDPESIVGYYLTLGYQCTEREPSTQAEGYLYESCQLVDPDGRTRTLGIVTDLNDDLADAVFSVRGRDGETILEPQAVLEPFAAFLGAVLGEERGTEALPWLAGTLGDDYATTTVGELTFATFTDSPDDHSKLTLEIANRAYLEAPRPSASPTP